MSTSSEPAVEAATPAHPAWIAFAVAAALLTAYLCLASGAMPREAVFMAAIFVLAALLWVTEALPLFATALLVLILQLILLANPGNWPGLGFESGPSPDYRTIILAAADPVLVLFFGGLLMAQAGVKAGVDRTISALLLRPFGEHPPWVLAGVMAVTALFSMFMSNTATAAMMIVLVAPMLAQIPRDDPFRKALLLGVAFAAGIGGMGTPIGSPPNAVALGYARNAGVNIGFLEWMVVAVPLMAVCLTIAWYVVWRLNRPREKDMRIRMAPVRVGGHSWFAATTFALTVLLWLTDRWHGLPAAVVALIPAVAFTASRTVTAADINRLDWSVLILIAGGISLGAGMSLTGLDRLIVQALPLDSGWGLAGISLILITATVLLSTFMSNTAAANLLLPIGVSAAMALDGDFQVRHIVITIALAAALAMALPISTPPNAMAYAKNEFAVRDMARAGVLIGIIGVVVVALFAPLLIRLTARIF